MGTERDHLLLSEVSRAFVKSAAYVHQEPTCILYKAGASASAAAMTSDETDACSLCHLWKQLCRTQIAADQNPSTTRLNFVTFLTYHHIASMKV